MFLIHLPSEVRVAVFGREALDVLFGADAPHLAAEVHGHVVLRSVAVLKCGIKKIQISARPLNCFCLCLTNDFKLYYVVSIKKETIHNTG